MKSWKEAGQERFWTNMINSKLSQSFWVKVKVKVTKPVSFKVQRLRELLEAKNLAE
jgi:hypothetical protein